MAYDTLPLYDGHIMCYLMEIIHQIDELVQEKRNSSALAMDSRLSCTNPSKYSGTNGHPSYTYVVQQSALLSADQMARYLLSPVAIAWLLL